MKKIKEFKEYPKWVIDKNNKRVIVKDIEEELAKVKVAKITTEEPVIKEPVIEEKKEKIVLKKIKK